MPDVLTPLQRQAAFKAAITLHEITMAQAATRLGVSYNHLTLVLKVCGLHRSRIGVAIVSRTFEFLR